jgi:hypothetical protein
VRQYAKPTGFSCVSTQLQVGLGVNNVIGWIEFNFLLIFLGGCGMDIKVIRFGYRWEWVECFAISRPTLNSVPRCETLPPQANVLDDPINMRYIL